MHRPLLGYLIALMAVFGVSAAANATTIILQTGEEVEGQVLEQTPLDIMLDVRGTPRTFYFGEIKSIDGKTVVIPADTSAVYAPGSVSNANVSNSGKKEASKIKPMKKITLKASKPPASSAHKKRASQAPQKIKTKAQGSAEMMKKVADDNKNVAFTPDGGIIVVSPGKVVKYDENLNVIKEINLNADNNAAGSN